MLIKKSKKIRHKNNLSKITGRYGKLFLLPWMIGFVFFFFVPVIQSIWYSFSSANPLVPREGELIPYLKEIFRGLSYYDYIWNEQPDFTNKLSETISSFLYSMPIIVALSLVFAIVLNQNFKGRYLARMVFFLPVIIATGAVMGFLNDNIAVEEMLSDGQSNTMYSSLSFKTLLSELGVPSSLYTRLDSYINSIFDLIWSCGIQTLLFLAGLQSIPQSCYEVAEVEGATAWETFWFVTVPMMMNVILLNIVYTSIELFTKESNAVMTQGYEFIIQADYNNGSAIIWSCCAVFAIIIGVIFVIMSGVIRRYES